MVWEKWGGGDKLVKKSGGWENRVHGSEPFDSFIVRYLCYKYLLSMTLLTMTCGS